MKKTAIILGLISSFISYKYLLAGPCELKIERNVSPCVVATDIAVFDDAEKEVINENACFDLGKVMSDAMSDDSNCSLRVPDLPDTHLIMFQYGGPQKKDANGVPNIWTYDRHKLSQLKGSVVIRKTRSFVGDDGPVSGPVTIDSPSGKFIIAGYKPLWFKGRDYVSCVSDDDYAQFRDTDLENVWRKALWDESDYPSGDGNGGIFSDDYTVKRSDPSDYIPDPHGSGYLYASRNPYTGELEEVEPDPLTGSYAVPMRCNVVGPRIIRSPDVGLSMDIVVDIEPEYLAHSYQQGVYAFDHKNGTVHYRDLSFTVEQGRVFRINDDSRVTFNRCKIDIKDSSDPDHKFQSPIYIKSDDEPDLYHLDLRFAERTSSPGDDQPLLITYAGDSVFRGYVRFSSGKVTEGQIRTLLENINMGGLKNRESYPIAFGSKPIMCITSDNGDVCYASGYFCKDENCGGIKVYHYNEGARNSSYKDLYELGSENIVIKMSGGKAFIELRNINSSSTYIITDGGGEFRNLVMKDQDEACDGDEHIVSDDDVIKCEYIDAEPEPDDDEDEDEDEDAEDTIECTGDFEPSANGTFCKCKFEKKYEYMGECYASKDDVQCPYAGQVRSAHDVTKYVTCSCPEGLVPNNATRACEVPSKCQITQANCAVNTTLVYASDGSCECKKQVATSECEAPKVMVDGKCKLPDAGNGGDVKECADDEELVGSECVPRTGTGTGTGTGTECDDGEELNDDGECVDVTTKACGDDEKWDVIDEKCIQLSTADDEAESDDDSDGDGGGGGCSFKKKSDGSYGCSLTAATANGGGMYIFLLLLGYFAAARLKRR